MSEWNEDLIPVSMAETLDGLFYHRVRRSPDRPAYRYFDKTNRTWRDLSWRETAEQVARWRDALALEHLEPGDRVAIQLRNCPEWIQIDQACLSLGLVSVPLYTDDRADNVAYILRDAAVRLLFIQDAGRWRRLRTATEGIDTLQRVVLVDGGPDDKEKSAESDRRILSARDWLPDQGAPLQQRNADPHGLASIVYTSGTTGRPKGVMLSHYNMLSVTHAALTMVDCYREDVLLSFLPLSHTLERTGGYYMAVMTGASVAFARSVAQLAEDLTTVRPTVLIAVPRIFERIYSRMEEKIRRGPAIARMLFHAAVGVGWRRFEHRQGRAGWSPKLLLWPLLERLVAGKITRALGGRLRAAVSGGAALSPEIARTFIGLGVPILQGYGLTETSPVISINTIEDNDPASVGLPLRGIQVRVGENDELLVKSPGIMLGYWNNHAATARMIDADGWLHTGDQGRIDRGHIYITGRLKDILVLSNGEKVPPADMEMAIALDPLFEQVMVVGEGRPFLSALVVLNADLWPGLARESGLDQEDPAGLNDRDLTGSMLDRIRTALKDFPGYAKIRRVCLLLEPWTIDNGLMTPTLKIKRAKVVERYAGQIERMYRSGMRERHIAADGVST